MEEEFEKGGNWRRNLRKGENRGGIYERGKMRGRLKKGEDEREVGKGENRGIQEGMQGEVEKNHFIKFL